jgi:site-specific recombinase XerD
MSQFDQDFFPAKNLPTTTVENSSPSLVIPIEGEQAWLYDNPVDAYLETLGSNESKRVMLSMIQQFVNVFKKNESDEDTPAQKMNWAVINRQAVLFALNKRKSAKASLSSMRVMLSAIRGVAREAWIMKMIRTDTYTRIKEVKAPKGSTVAAGRALPLSQMNALLDVCRETTGPTSARDLAMLSILMVCGVRRSELVSIDIEDLDKEDRSIKITGKGNKERMIYLDEEALADVCEWIDEYLPHDTGPMFTRVRSGGDVTSDRLTDQAVRYMLEQRCMQAGVDVIRPHDMRRSFATHMLDTIDPLTVQDMLGHSSVETTKKYDRRGEKRKKEAANGFRNKQPKNAVL